MIVTSIQMIKVQPMSNAEPYGLYTCLGLQRDATPQQIKKAYRNLAMQHHPDKGGDPEMFKSLTHAHSTLTDPGKRQQYDRNGGREGGEVPTFDPTSFFSSGVNGMYHPFHSSRRTTTTTPPVYTLKCTLEELYMGVTKTIAIVHDILCQTCTGHGSLTRSMCSHCQGQGSIVSTQALAPGYIQQTTRTCSPCAGTGKIPGKLCTVCSGKGHKSTRTRHELHVPKGTFDDTIIATLQKLGGVSRTTSGQYHERSLVIKVSAQPHNIFRRVQNHLVMDLNISLLDALCGFSTTVVTLDQKSLRIHSPRQYPCVDGTILKVARHGFVSSGHLFVQLKVIPLGNTIQDVPQIQQLEILLKQKYTRDQDVTENTTIVDPQQFQTDTTSSTRSNSSTSGRSDCHMQ